MAEHTPGPLTAGLNMPEVANNNPDPRVIWKDSMAIGSAVCSWLPRDVQEANARLWALSPQMLEGLEMAVKYIASTIRYESSSFDMPPEPATPGDLEADLLCAHLSGIIRNARGPG